MKGPRRPFSRALAVALALGLAAAGWYAVAAARARREAARQRGQAEALVDSMLGALEERLADPGRIDRLDSAGARALAWLEQEPTEALTDRERVRRASLLVLTGDARRARNDLDGALAAYRRAEDLARDLASSSPADRDRHLALSSVRLRLGGLQLERHDAASALVLARDVAEDATRLAAAEAVEPHAAASSRKAALRLAGAALEELGRLDEAIAALRAGVVESRPDAESAEGQGIDESSALRRLAALLERRGQLTEAVARRERLLELARLAELRAPRSDATRIARLEATLLAGELRLMRGELATAGAHFEAARAATVRETAREVEVGGSSPERRSRLCVRLACLRARLAFEQGSVKAAERLAEEALEAAEGLPGQRSGESEPLRLQAVARLRVASARLALGAPSSAIAAAGEATRVLSQLAGESSSDVDLALASEAALLRAGALDRLGHHTEARELRGDTAVWLVSRARESGDPRLLDPLVHTLILLDRTDEAEPFARRLAEAGYALPSHVARCRAAALPVTGSGVADPTDDGRSGLAPAGTLRAPREPPMEPNDPGEPDLPPTDASLSYPRWLTARSIADLAVYELEPHLLTGRQPLTAPDVERLAKLGVTHVLDLREDREWKGVGRRGSEAVDAMPAYGIERLGLPIGDGEAPDREILELAVAFLERVTSTGPDPKETLRERPGTAYVHCRAGIERTGTIVLAHLCRREGLPVDRVLETITTGDSPYAPLPWQVSVVRRWLATPRAPAAPDEVETELET